MTWLVLTFAILCNAFANILIKAAMRGKGGAAALLSALLSPFMIGGVAFFIVALAAYSYVLSKMNLSTAYPIMTSLGFIVVLTASWLFFHETIKGVHILGYVLIISGVWLVTR